MPAVLVKKDGDRYWYLLLFGHVKLEDALEVIERAGCNYDQIVVFSDERNKGLVKRLRWALGLC